MFNLILHASGIVLVRRGVDLLLSLAMELVGFQVCCFAVAPSGLNRQPKWRIAPDSSLRATWGVSGAEHQKNKLRQGPTDRPIGDFPQPVPLMYTHLNRDFFEGSSAVDAALQLKPVRKRPWEDVGVCFKSRGKMWT